MDSNGTYKMSKCMKEVSNGAYKVSNGLYHACEASHRAAACGRMMHSVIVASDVLV